MKTRFVHTQPINAQFKRAFACLLVMTFALLGVLLNSAPASAQAPTIVVNSALDNVKFGCDPTHCTLREAILQANSTVGVMETIQFNINPVGNPKCVPLTGVCTITVKKALPMITDHVVIDGYSQPGASPNSLAVGNNAKIKIVLDGKTKSFPGLGFQPPLVPITDPPSRVKGLAIIRFSRGLGLYGYHTYVTGNFVGMKANGTTGAGNDDGVVVDSGHNNRIGGAFAGDRNVISGNYGQGIYVLEAISTVIQNNYIGTDASGMFIPGNGANGILIYKSNSTRIGSDGQSGTTNIISGNLRYAIEATNGGSDLTVDSNWIGVGSDGKFPLPNGGGIWLKSWNGFIVKNVIAHNLGTGIHISGNFGNNFVSRNSIFNNKNLGIDLGNMGQTPNDDKDQDTGANGLQNYPELTKIQATALGTTIKAKLNSLPFTKFRIEYFTNPTCDASSYGEGKTFLGDQEVTTGIDGKAKFSWQTNKILKKGTHVTATATEVDSNNKPLNTSEFSKCMVVP